MFSHAAPDVVEWAGEKYALQMVPGSQFEVKCDSDCPGIQMADVVLWLYGQFLKAKYIPPGCARIVRLALERGWHDDFSFEGVHSQIMEKWGDVFFGPIEPEKLEAARKMLEGAETRRLASMAQFETDGLPPFARNIPAFDAERSGLYSLASANRQLEK
jgi:hypothetical protein